MLRCTLDCGTTIYRSISTGKMPRRWAHNDENSLQYVWTQMVHDLSKSSGHHILTVISVYNANWTFKTAIFLIFLIASLASGYFTDIIQTRDHEPYLLKDKIQFLTNWPNHSMITLLTQFHSTHLGTVTTRRINNPQWRCQTKLQKTTGDMNF